MRSSVGYWTDAARAFQSGGVVVIRDSSARRVDK
jgi:hypothetical protein